VSTDCAETIEEIKQILVAFKLCSPVIHCALFNPIACVVTLVVCLSYQSVDINFVN